MLKPLLTALLLSFAGTLAYGQFLEEPFDFDLTGGGFTSADFVFVADGTGASTPGWNNRSRLRSASEGGAVLLGNPGTNGRLLSPQFDVTGTELYLSFYHYFRTGGGNAAVTIFDNGGTTLLTVPIVPNLAAGEETSAGKYEIIDLSAAFTLGAPPYQLEFTLTGGDAAFWLIDDILVDEVEPVYPTFPRYFGEQLTTFGEPFVTDSLGAAARPFELVLDFAPGTTPAEREDIRTQLGADRIKSCVCDRLEVWELPGGDFFDPNTGQPLGDPGRILTGKLGSSSTGKVDNIELNFLNYHELQNVPAPANPPLTPAVVAGFPTAPVGVINIAVLDTGIDLDHPTLAPYVYRSGDALNGDDDDENCYPDDPLGYNFVDENNNPTDDHSHGTHVAGIVAQRLGDCQNCAFRIVPYKTHNSFGVGTLFATACATLQAAVNDDAAVINASWGFYGGGSDILRAAIDTAADYGAFVAAAAGNDSLNLVADLQHPATFDLPNILSVGVFAGSENNPQDRADFTNYNPAFVDIFAPGINVISAVPDNALAPKTGTSQATPAVSAAAALRTCDAGRDPVATRSFLLAGAKTFPQQVGDFVLDGNVLDTTGLCAEMIVTEGETTKPDFSICLRQAEEVIDVRALRDLVGVDVRLVSPAGTIVANPAVRSFRTGESELLNVAGGAAGEYTIVIVKGGRTFVQRLVKR